MDIRTIVDGEVGAFRDCVMTTFGDDRLDCDPDGDARFRALVTPGRAWAAFDGGRIVGTAATLALEVAVPGGGSVATAGLTMVTVRPTHTRRGLLRALVQRHLDDARARGDSCSALWASEGAIYGRFGYGIATEGDALELDTRSLAFASPAAHTEPLDYVDEAEARELLPPIYARATAHRPGTLRRTPAWWHERRFLEAPFIRAGASRRRHVIARRGADAVGYVAFRQRDIKTRGITEIIELVAIDTAAEAALWRFIAAIDLFPTATWGNAPIDSPLPWLLADPRRVTRRRADALWLRVDDVATALAARHYAADGVLHLTIEDKTWELAVTDRRASCRRTESPPHLALDRAALGTILLGGIAPSALARVSRIRGDAAHVALADHMFASAIAPWCPETF